MSELSRASSDRAQRHWPSFLFGFVLIWAVLYGGGELQGGDVRHGVLACAATLLAAALWELLVFKTPALQLGSALGLGRPNARSLAAGTFVALFVAVFYVAFSRRWPLTLRPDWPWLACGLFAYHGVAEEVAWRGYAFRRLREGRSFNRAVFWTMPLLVLTHVPIIMIAGPLVGCVAMAVAAITCWPLAYLWERGGRTIWAPALVHAAIDLFKLIEPPTGPAALTFSVSLGLASMLIPLSAFPLTHWLHRSPPQRA